MLTDSLFNMFSLHIVSEKVKTILSDLALDYLELHPVTILNHKNRPTDENYFLVQPVGNVDCIDQAASNIKFSNIIKTNINRIRSLVLDETKIPANKPIFLLDHFGQNLVVHHSVAKTLEDAGVTGILWTPIDKFKY